MSNFGQVFSPAPVPAPAVAPIVSSDDTKKIPAAMSSAVENARVDVLAAIVTRLPASLPDTAAPPRCLGGPNQDDPLDPLPKRK
jgi:hypothetical protein